jgi:steroid Delta-isomerase
MASTTLELRRVIQVFETITEESLDKLADLYGADSYFKDPFNEVQGRVKIRGIFAAMFEQVTEPRFKVIETVQNQTEKGDAFLVWDFSFRFKHFKVGDVQVIRGTSHLRFDSEGKIVFHRDYWDAAEELYEKIPLLGILMRLIKRRAQH